MDLLRTITAKAQEARDLKLQIADLEERIDAAKASLRTVLRETLPDLMGEAGLPSLTIEATGNAPAFSISIKPFARAAVLANWDEDRKQAAFEWLDANGAGDLIKTDVTVALDRNARSQALDLIQALQRMGYAPNVQQAVHHATLTKWLKEALKRGVVVPMDTLGAEAGREAVIKEA